jgi:TetR/AcrR family transcriptional regulator, transcriptional repressor for nem operon
VTDAAPALKPQRPGRPREFDIDAALDKAVRIFCERGYYATSIGDLTAAMELASGSIYKAFKDKRAVFLAAFDRYKIVRDEQLQCVLDATKSSRERVRDVLAFYVASSYGVEGRRGCLVVGSAVELAIFDAEIAARVTSAVKKNEALLADLIEQGQRDGSIPSSLNGQATARLMVCLTQGLRVLGKTGQTRAETTGLVDIAMKLLA